MLHSEEFYNAGDWSYLACVCSRYTMHALIDKF